MNFARACLVCLVVTPVFAGLALVTGCGDSSEADARVAETAREIQALRASNEETRQGLATVLVEIKRLGRRLEQQSVRHAVTPTVGTPAAEGDDTSEAAASATPAPAVGDAGVEGELDAWMGTDRGREVVKTVAKQAAEEVAAQRAKRDRDTFVAYELARFAREAKLSEWQSTEMKKVWGDAMSGARELVAGLRGVQKLPEAERAAKMADLRAGMMKLGADRTERMRALLDADQLKAYEAREETIDAGLHGVPTNSGRPPERDDSSAQ